eukprot:gb/GECG01005742.1/.p1 GENE.gb/GECG01005742.1/~~gb/GECG01005742.1/.p1  ORF type:complete len:826 (+),score=109.87 gb/GECG01005742.1/:1-2478(+)
MYLLYRPSYKQATSTCYYLLSRRLRHSHGSTNSSCRGGYHSNKPAHIHLRPYRPLTLTMESPQEFSSAAAAPHSEEESTTRTTQDTAAAAADNGASGGTEQERRKRKRMMLVVAYDGTKYHGSFSVPHSSVNTVDKQLWEALKKCDRVKVQDELRKEPSFPLKQTGISRCSRTDKGVHALRYMLSLDLAILESEISWGRQAHHIADEINEFLPEDIRVTSCVRVSNKFQAKKAASSKVYDYYLPVSIFQRDLSNRLQSLGRGQEWNGQLTEEETEGLRRYNTCMQKMIGIHSFHNFTKPKDRKSMVVFKGDPPSQRMGDSANNWTLFANEHDDFTPRTDEDFSSVSLWKKTSNGVRQIYAIDVSEPFTFSVSPQSVSQMRDQELYDSVFSPQDPNSDTFCSLPLIKTSLIGSAFIFNQIRHMVGLAVAVGRGIVSEEYVDWALSLPRVPMLPLAPPGTLLLRDVDFDAKYFMCSELPKSQRESSIPVIAKEMRDYLLEEGEDFSNASFLAIMHPPSLDKENKFFEEELKPRLVANSDTMFEYPDYVTHARERAEFVAKVKAERYNNGGANSTEANAQEITANVEQLKEQYSHILKHPFYTRWQGTFGGWIALNDESLDSESGRKETAVVKRRYELWKEAIKDFEERSGINEWQGRVSRARNVFGDQHVWPEILHRSLEPYWKGDQPKLPEDAPTIDPSDADFGKWRHSNEKVNMYDSLGVLPQGFRTSVMIKFRIFPARSIHSLMQAVALRLVDGTWPLLASTEEYHDLIRRAGIDALLDEGMHAAYLQRAQEIAGAFERGGGKYLNESKKRQRDSNAGTCMSRS